MKKISSLSFYVLGAAFLALISCNDPTAIGSDLLAGDQLDIEFTDTLTILASSEESDSIRTFSPIIIGQDFSNFPVGHFNDPVFGKTISSVYSEVSLNSTDAKFTGSVLDSIVLILPWQAGQNYGDLAQTYKLEVYELDESLYDSLSYYSNDSFSVKSPVIGSLEFVPMPADSVTVIEPSNSATIKTQKLIPHVRIKLDGTFSQQFFEADTAVFQDEAKFSEFFKGFWVKPASENGGLLNFNLRNSLAGMKVYYHKDTVYSQYTFPIGTFDVVTAHYEHYYGGSTAQEYIGKPGEVNGDLLFLQGLQGLDIIFEIPYAENMKDILVNRAEIELPIVKLPGDVDDPVEQIIIYEIINDTTRVLVSDVQFAINRAANDFNQIFGGDVDNGTYKLNISSHFQDMIAGKVSKKLLITVYFKPERTARVVLGGPSNATSPAKLNLSFTRY